MVVHPCNFISGRVERGGSEVQDLPWLHREFEISLGYMRPLSKTNKQKTKIKMNNNEKIGIPRGTENYHNLKVGIFSNAGFLKCGLESSSLHIPRVVVEAQTPSGWIEPSEGTGLRITGVAHTDEQLPAWDGCSRLVRTWGSCLLTESRRYPGKMTIALCVLQVSLF